MIQLANDFEYICAYKNGSDHKQILSYLWNRYQPLVLSVVRSHFRYNQTDLEYQDCIHNCFLCFPQVLDKIKIEKIKNRELFSFGQMLKLYLKGYTRSSIKHAININYHSESSTMYENDDDYTFMRLPPSFVSKENVEKDFERQYIKNDFKNLLKMFYDACSEDEKKLLTICIERNTCSESKSRFDYISTAAFIRKGYAKQFRRRKKITPQYFYQKVNKLERGFIHYMQRYGYYSKSSLKSVGLEKLA